MKAELQLTQQKKNRFSLFKYITNQVYSDYKCKSPQSKKMCDAAAADAFLWLDCYQQQRTSVKDFKKKKYYVQ